MPMILIILLTIWFSPTISEACQRYSDETHDHAGNVIASANIQVVVTGTMVPATLYSDSLCATIKPNPTQSGSDGIFTFFIKDGIYDLITTRTGYVFNQATYISIFDPLGENIVTVANYTTTDLCQAGTGAIDQIGATAITLVINKPVTCSVSKTIPATLTLQRMGGGLITIATGQILTINSPAKVIADANTQFFAGAGTVAFTNGGELYCRWWPMVVDGTTDDAAAFQACLTASPAGSIVHLPFGTTHITTGLTVDRPLTIKGAGFGSITSQYGTTITGTGITLMTFSHLQGFRLEDMVLYDPTGHASTIGIDISNSGVGVVKWVIRNVSLIAPTATFGTLGTGIRGITALEGVVENCVIEGWLKGIDWQSGGGVKSNGNEIRGTKIRQNTTGLLLTDVDDSFLTGSILEGNSTGVKVDSGHLMASSNHFENNLGNMQNIWATGGHISSTGNFYAAADTTYKDIYISAGAALHSSVNDTLNFGIRHEGTGIFTLTNPALAPTVSGAGPVARIDGLNIVGLQNLTGATLNISGYAWVAVANPFQIGSSGAVTSTLRWNATATVADGGTVAHGMGATPTAVLCTPSTSGEMCSVTVLDGTNFTVTLKKHDGSAGTTQTIYWMALK